MSWIDPKGDLFAWDSQMVRPVRVLAARSIIDTGDDSRPLQFVTLVGPFMVFNNNGEGFILDRRTWSYARLGGAYPIATQGTHLWVSLTNAMALRQSLGVPTGGYSVPVRELSALPSCPGSRR